MTNKYLHIVFFLAVAILVTTGLGCSTPTPSTPPKEDNPLIGEWEFLYSQLIFPDTTITLDSTQYYSVYMVGQDYFSFFYASPDKKSLLGAGHGRYTLEGSIYIEHVEYHSQTYISGTSVIFDSQIENDIWTHDGFLPVREEEGAFSQYAKGNPTFRIVEVRRRIK